MWFNFTACKYVLPNLCKFSLVIIVRSSLNTTGATSAGGNENMNRFFFVRLIHMCDGAVNFCFCLWSFIDPLFILPFLEKKLIKNDDSPVTF